MAYLSATLPALLRCQHRIPDGGRSSVFDAQPAEVELFLMDPAKQFDAGYDNRRGPEPLEAEHWTDAQLDAAVVLLDHDRSFVSAASSPTAFISRTARCDAAYPSNVICGGSGRLDRFREE
jgi:hypothetical protein